MWAPRGRLMCDEHVCLEKLCGRSFAFGLLLRAPSTVESCRCRRRCSPAEAARAARAARATLAPTPTATASRACIATSSILCFFKFRENTELSRFSHWPPERETFNDYRPVHRHGRGTHTHNARTRTTAPRTAHDATEVKSKSGSTGLPSALKRHQATPCSPRHLAGPRVAY